MRIVKSELKKIFKNRAIFIALAVFIALDLFNIYRNYNINSGVPDSYADDLSFVENQLDGKLTQDKIDLINSKVNSLQRQLNGEFAEQKEPDGEFLTGYAFWDLSLWTSYKNYIDRAEEYSQAVSSKLETAQRNIEFFSGKNEYYAGANRLYYDTYNGRKITEIYDTDRLPEYFEYSLSSVLTVIILLMGVIPIFCSENECDMNTVLLTSINGRQKTVNAKIAAGLIFTLGVTILFSLFDFAGFMLFDKLDGLSQSIYAVQGYGNCPLNIKVWQFILLQLAFKCVGMCLISLVFLLLSRLFKKSNLPFICGLGAFFAMMLCKVFFTSQTGQNVNLINSISFLTAYNVFADFKVINLFGQPVFRWQFMLAAGLILIIILYFIIMLLPLNTNRRERAPVAFLPGAPAVNPSRQRANINKCGCPREM